jgi:hypothetical protein
MISYQYQYYHQPSVEQYTQCIPIIVDYKDLTALLSAFTSFYLDFAFSVILLCLSKKGDKELP